MSIFIASVPNFNLISRWKVVYGGGQYYMSPTPSTASADKIFSFAGIPAGSTIISAKLTADLGSPATGAALRTVAGSSFSGSKDVAITVGGSNTFAFKFRANGIANSPAGDRSSTLSFSNVKITVEYNAPGESGGSGGGGSSSGGVSVNKTWLDAGSGAVTVTCPAQAGIWHMGEWSFGSLNGTWSHPWQAGGSYDINPLLDWINQLPNATSGTLYIKVRLSNTPAMPYSFVSEANFTVAINVPASIVPSIGAFTAERIVNNTPPSISDYVQNISGIRLTISSAAGAYGSTIVGLKISGGGFDKNASVAEFSPLPTAGNNVFTAEVTDSRGRKAAASIEIDVLAYTPISASGIQAYRSDAGKNPANEGIFASLKAKMVVGSLDGQNTGEVKGRVYEKGTAPPAWTTMANDTLVLFGGSLSIEKVYTADILVADLITSYQYSIDIPTATVIMGIAPDGDGVSFGTYPEAGKVKSAWKYWQDGNPVCDFIVGDILISTSNISPAARWPGTAWAAIPSGRSLRTGTGGEESGSDMVTLNSSHIPAMSIPIVVPGYGWLISSTYVAPQANSGWVGLNPGGAAPNFSGAYALWGNMASAFSVVPKSYHVYAWRRTA